MVTRPDGTAGDAVRCVPGLPRLRRLRASAPRKLLLQLAYRWTLTELAEQLHLAPGYLVRLFKAATGLPPMAYLARLHAATLLLHSDQPVTCIGQAVGWPDQNYFARRFKAHYGLSATAYRARFAVGAIHLAPTERGGTTSSTRASPHTVPVPTAAPATVSVK